MYYFDWAATTPVKPEVKEVIIDTLDKWGNPSSVYRFGAESKAIITNARERIAATINAKPEDIIFTSGGSEANNLILNNKNISVSDIEHASIMNNNNVTNIFHFEDLGGLFASVWSEMYVNNETGSIQPIQYMAETAHRYNVIFHTDAVQAYPHLHINVNQLKVDAMSVSGHKFGAPKGIGFLYANSKARESLEPIIAGGKQEFGFRGGTENVAYINGLALACELCQKDIDNDTEYIRELNSYTLSKLKELGAIVNYEGECISNILNVRIPGISNEALVEFLNIHHVYISAGSACHEGDPKPSHVLTALGLTKKESSESIRISLAKENTKDDVDELIRCIKSYIELI